MRSTVICENTATLTRSRNRNSRNSFVVCTHQETCMCIPPTYTYTHTRRPPQYLYHNRILTHNVIWKRHDNVICVSSFNLKARFLLPRQRVSTPRIKIYSTRRVFRLSRVTRRDGIFPGVKVVDGEKDEFRRLFSRLRRKLIAIIPREMTC